MVDVITPCGSLVTGICYTDFWVFWSLIIVLVTVPLMMFVFFYMLPGSRIVGAFLKARLNGAPVIFKARRDMRTDIIVGEYKSGVIFAGNKEGFIPQQDSFYVLPHGFRWAAANEMYGTTLPHKLVKDIQWFKDKGFRTMEEAENWLIAKEQKILALAGKDVKGLTPEQQEEVDRIRKQKTYVSYLKKEEAEHQKMFLPFSRINNFFKNNINPAYIRSAIEEAVAEALAKAGKMDIQKIVMVVIIMSFVAVIIIAIISSIDLGGSGSAPVALPALTGGIGIG